MSPPARVEIPVRSAGFTFQRGRHGTGALRIQPVARRTVSLEQSGSLNGRDQGNRISLGVRVLRGNLLPSLILHRRHRDHRQQHDKWFDLHGHSPQFNDAPAALHRKEVYAFGLMPRVRFVRHQPIRRFFQTHPGNRLETAGCPNGVEAMASLEALLPDTRPVASPPQRSAAAANDSGQRMQSSDFQLTNLRTMAQKYLDCSPFVRYYSRRRIHSEKD